MQRRQLGEKKVGSVGLGCMSFGGFYGPATEADSHDTLKAALDLGIDHLDIADIYGPYISEEVVGSFIAKNGNKFHIATKGGIDRGPPRGFNNSADYLNGALDASLKRLQLDHVDLYYVHRREQDRPIEEVTDTLVAMQKAGKIRAFGFSEISPSSLDRALSVGPVAAVQNEYSLWTRLPDLGLVEKCRKNNVALAAFSPLARGMLTDVVPVPAEMDKIDHRNAQPRFGEPNYSFNVAAMNVFRTYARDHGWPAASLAIAWVLHRGDHIIPIPGTRTVDHLKELAIGADIILSNAQMVEIEEILPAGFAHGDRYSVSQYVGPEKYC